MAVWKPLLITSLLLSGFAVQSGALAGLSGDPGRGARVYERCAGCHSLDRNRIGPAHRGVVGRQAGSVEDYRYSAVLKDSRILWDEANLDLWLADPGAFIPGSRMGYRLSDPQDRADVIAYLRQAGDEERD